MSCTKDPEVDENFYLMIQDDKIVRFSNSYNWTGLDLKLWVNETKFCDLIGDFTL